jgi:ribosome-associated protein
MELEQFDLDGHEFIELNNLLKITGMCESGGQAKMYVGAGHVKVDGAVELRKRCKIRTGQVVEFNGDQVQVV